MSETRLCIDCEHANVGWHVFCENTEIVPLSRVTGRPVMRLAENSRAMHCLPEGRHFKPRRGFFAAMERWFR